MKRNVLIIGAVVVIILVVAGVFGWNERNASAAAKAQVQTTTVQRGNIVATVAAAGNVSAPQQSSVAFQTSGRVTKVSVQLGDQVKAGQVLMELDTSDLQLALQTAQASLASAQANYDQQQSNLNNAVKTAQANVASAQANYDSEKSKADQNPNQLIVAKAALDKATVALQTAQGNYNAIAWRGDVGMTSQAAALASATDDYNSALATYKITAAGINDTALRTAQAQLDNANVALAQAQSDLTTSMKVAQASLDNAKVAVSQAQSNLAKTQVVAPIDGMVAAVNYNVGDTAGSGSGSSTASSGAVSLANLNQLQVKVTVAEVDMAQLKVGDTAQMSLDALPGSNYTAKVIAIGPVGTITQGVVNYPVTVAVDGSNPEIKPGMTANLDIAVDQRQNVLIIPTRAVRTQGNAKMVTVLYKGLQIQTPVTLGLQSDTSVEVMNGLQEGDVLVLNQTTTTSSSRGFGGGGIPFVGGFGGR